MDQRVLELQGAENVRELGGYPTVSDRQTHYHKVLRSADLSRLTDKDIEVLREYGLKTVVDFRSESEQKEAPDVKIDGVKYISLPIFPEDSPISSASPQAMMEQIKEPSDGTKIIENLYASFAANEYSVKMYARFFQLLLENTEKGSVLLFHCTAGKDRTGFAAAILLKLLGVDDLIVFQDYQLTNENLGEMKVDLQKTFQEKKVPEIFVEAANEILKADPDYLAIALKSIDRHFGSFENFLEQGLQLTKEDQEKIKTIYRTR